MSKYHSAPTPSTDEIQEIIAQIQIEMPEVKTLLDQADIPFPPSLHEVPLPKRNWLERLGDWAVRPGWKLPDTVSATGLSVAVTFLPMLLGCLMTEVILLLFWFGKG